MLCLQALDAVAMRRERGGAGRSSAGARGAAGGGRGSASGTGYSAGGASVRWRGTDGGGMRPEAVVHTRARRIVDQALAIYSYAAANAARQVRRLLPMALSIRASLSLSI